ncbi:CoA ester lyase [Dactylosporangium sp. AC04546]|uniref:HpcH/HpaI aldolase/citrate lyase family protein n=1 Tax=Dactylosporangium sp. AC04546 TaxID=2862460 RepID=UPI001EDE3465|nr:CoA ester lyase [Dactylosporangium sp. AC04546]WVK81980.1 CoA ester lyase [Dactylosporangium sp. AC04546]
MLLTSLYVPGDRPDRFAKAVASGADAVILDLEDAVAVPRKPYARAAVAEFLSGSHPVPVLVRVNDLDGPQADADRATLAGLADGARPAGLKVPKVESRRGLGALAAQVRVPLHPLIESALGVEAAHAVATHPAVASIGLGEADLRSDLGADGDEALAWVRGRIVVAARAAGLPAPAMSVYPNVTDLDGLAASCAAGRRLGFLGRAAIHPRQLPVIVAAFRPSAQDVALAETLLAALAEARQHDSGTAVLPDGRFADRAMVAAARRTLDLAARYA